MKKFRKIMAVLVAAMMIVATMVPAWAASSPKQIIINFNLNGATGNETNVAAHTETIPANSDYAWYEFTETLPNGTQLPAGKTVFLGWNTDENATVPLDRILLTREMNSPLNVYAIYGTKKDSKLASTTELSFGTQGTITIANCAKGETYTAYQLFKLYSWDDDNILPDSHTADKEAYSYYIVKGNSAAENPMYGWLKDYTFSYKDGENTVSEYAFEFYDNEGHTATAPANITPSTPVIYPDYSITQTVNNAKTSNQDESWKFVPVRVNPKFMTMAKSGTADEATKEEYQDSAAVIQKFAQDAMNTLTTTIYSTTGVNAGKNTAFEKFAGKATASAVDNSTNPATLLDTVTFESLEYGYYLVDSTLGSLCSLDTTNPTALIIEKNEFTQVGKVVTENLIVEQNDGDADGDRNDANIGEDVEFTSTVIIPLRQSNVVFHDIMSTHFTFKPETLSVTGLPEGKKYTFYYGVADGTYGESPNQVTAKAMPSETLYAGDTFAIAFDSTVANGTEGITAETTTVTIKYKATLNNTAIIGPQTGLEAGQGNDNQAKVTFGSKQTTQIDWTRTYTWSYEIFKYAKLDAPTYKAKTTTTGEGQSATTSNTYSGEKAAAEDQHVLKESGTDAQWWEKVNPLQGATFNVKRGATLLTFSVKTAATSDTDPIVYILDTTSGSADLVSPKSGLIVIEGLDADDYTVEETVSPVGYARLNETIPVKIESDTSTQTTNNAGQTGVTSTLKVKNYEKELVSIQNITSKEMPQTGGMGTTVLYIVGGMLVILAGAYLFFSRKRTA